MKNGFGDRYKEVSDQFYNILNKKLSKTDINHHAFNVMVHLKDRKNLYLGDELTFKRIVNELSKPLAMVSNVTVSTPILESMKTMDIIN